MTLAISAGLLVCGAVYLLLRRELLRVILGFILLGHAVNLILMASGGSAGRTAPFGTFNDTSGVADPLPQAFVLTAIVIAFSITIFLLSLAITGKHDDDTVDEDTTDDQTVDDGTIAEGTLDSGDPGLGTRPRTSMVGTVADEERLA